MVLRKENLRICPICKQNIVTGRFRVCDSPICRKEMERGWNESTIAIPEGYMDANCFAKKKGISRQAVTKNCRAGEYAGAFQDPQSGRWYIPVTENVSTRTAVDRRKKRILMATDREWKQIVEKAAMTKHSVNDYILRKAFGSENRNRKETRIVGSLLTLIGRLHILQNIVLLFLILTGISNCMIFLYSANVNNILKSV